MDNIKEFVTELKWRVDGHENEIAILKESSSDLKKTLDLIILTLKQIKWLAIGAAAVIFADKLGFMGMLKLAAL